MATTWIADTFRGSGALAGTSAPVKVAAVAAWADISSAGSSNRSASGATWTEPGVASGGTLSAIDGVTTRGTGVLVAEIKVFGASSLALSFDGGTSYAYLEVDGVYYGGPGISFTTPVTTTYVADTLRATSTPTVLRVEVDATVLRAYVDGTLFATHTHTIPPANVIDAIAILVESGRYPGYGATTLFADYINVVLGTTSGPLGYPGQGANSSLPHLTAFGEGYAHGNAAYSLPLLYAVPAPIPPTFWAAKVGVREA